MGKLYMPLKLEWLLSNSFLVCVSLIKILIPKGKRARFLLVQNVHMPICPFARESGGW